MLRAASLAGDTGRGRSLVVAGVRRAATGVAVEHKEGLFAAATAMLALAGFMQWRARTLPCPADPALAATCMRTRTMSLRIYAVSLAIFLIGGFFAFIAPLLSV